MCSNICFQRFSKLFSFRKSSPLELADIISLDYIVNGQFVSMLDENETISLNFSQNFKTTRDQVSVFE